MAGRGCPGRATAARRAGRRRGVSVGAAARSRGRQAGPAGPGVPGAAADLWSASLRRPRARAGPARGRHDRPGLVPARVTHSHLLVV